MTKASKTKVMAKVKEALREQAKEPMVAPGNQKTMPPPQALTSADEMQRAQEYVSGLLQGKAKQSNRYVRDLLQQVQQAEQELARLVPQIERTRSALEQAQTRHTALRAISHQHALTLYRWRDDKKN